MIFFPNAKINIGLKVLDRRDDGYHNIESVLYPIDLYDILEVQSGSAFNISYSGIDFDKNGEYISEMMTWLKEGDLIKPLSIHLHKSIPIQSGLGGGSSDLAFFTNFILNNIRNDDLKIEVKRKAIELSSDTAFFLKNKAAFVQGRGESVKSIELDLSGYQLLLMFPNTRI